MTDAPIDAPLRRDTRATMERFLELMPVDVLAAVRETTADDLVWWSRNRCRAG